MQLGPGRKHAGLDAALGELDAARRVCRTILRRRAAALAGTTLVYAIWAAGAGAHALLGLVPLLLACGFVAAQLAAPPGRDFSEGVRALLLAELGGGIRHRRLPRDTAPDTIVPGSLVPGDGWIVEDRLEGGDPASHWMLLAARHRDGRGLLLGRVDAAPPHHFAWALPRPLFAFTWTSPVGSLNEDLATLRAALRTLGARDAGATPPGS